MFSHVAQTWCQESSLTDLPIFLRVKVSNVEIVNGKKRIHTRTEILKYGKESSQRRS